MAACAWLFGRRMGGEAVYFGERVHKPVLGGSTANWDGRCVETLFRLVYLSGFGMVFVSMSLHYYFEVFFS